MNKTRKALKIRGEERMAILTALLNGRVLLMNASGSCRWKDKVRSPSVRNDLVAPMFQTDWLKDTGNEVTLTPLGRVLAEYREAK